MDGKTNLLIIFTAILGSWLACNNQHAAVDFDQDKYIVLVKYKSLPGKEKEALTNLSNLITTVSHEPHFVNIKLHVDPKDQSNILLYEVWDDSAYYHAAHMETPHLQRFITDSKNFLGGPPEITTWQIEKDCKLN